MQAEKKAAAAAAQGDDGHGNPEIDRLRQEVQDTKEINRKLRELLQVPDKGLSAEHLQAEGEQQLMFVRQEPQNQSLSAERHSHTVALQVLERQAKEDVLSERTRLQTLLQLELGNAHTCTHAGRHAQPGTHTTHAEITNSTPKLLLPWIRFTMATAEDYM